jgi:Rha family phage regulatory protein
MAGNAAGQAGRSLKTKKPQCGNTEASVNEINFGEEIVMSKNITVVDMRKFVEARDGKAFTTTHQVATAFGKLHNHVIAKVRSLECSAQFLTDNFSSVQFEHRGNVYEAFEMTKDGFMFLVMGFTGKPAAAIKEAYIAAFNEMAARLSVDAEAVVGDLVGAVIGSTGEVVLDSVIDQKAYLVPGALQRSFRHTMKSRLRTRFNVQRTALIPAECLADACNFVAAYVLEGEFIAKEQSSPKAEQLNLHFPIGTLVQRRPGMLIQRGSGGAWLDVTINDLRDIRGEGTPLENLIYALRESGFDVEGCWWELRTYRNKIFELARFANCFTHVLESPHRYSVDVEDAA